MMYYTIRNMFFDKSEYEAAIPSVASEPLYATILCLEVFLFEVDV